MIVDSRSLGESHSFSQLSPIHLCAITIAALLGPSAVFAQSVASTARSQAQDPGGSEIIVTAQKRSEAIEDVPISIQSLAATRLGIEGANNLQQLPQLVPGLRVDFLGSRVQPTIRGVSTTAGGPGNNANVAVYIDGFFQPSQMGNALDFINIDSIQVVKGPQGTLFGRNATGGAIVINTLAPKFEPLAALDLSYGSYDDKRASFYGTTGLTKNLAIDLAAYIRRSDGFITNIVTGGKPAYIDHTSIRSSILYEPTDKLSFKLALSHSNIDDPSTQVYSLDPGRPGTAQALFLAPGSITTDKRKETAENTPGGGQTKTDSVYLTSELDVAFGKITSYTGYRNERSWQSVDLDGSNATLFGADYFQYSKLFTQELQLASTGIGPFKWSTGAFYLHDKAGIPALNFQFCQDCNVNVLDSKLTTESWALYADGTYNVTGGLFATAGVRYSKDQQYYVWSAPSGADSPRNSWSGWSPRAALRYEFSPRTNVYVSYSQGFKAGTFNSFSPDSTPVASEKIKAWEVGFKWAGGGWRFSTAAYYYDYSNLQVNTYDLARGLSTLKNAAVARIKGVEADLSGEILPGLSIYANGAYTHARYLDFPAAEDIAPSSNGIGFVNVAANATGNTMLRSPTWTGNVGGTYRVETGIGALSFNANLYLTSKVYYDAPNRYVQPGYEVLNLSAGWESLDKHYNLTLFAKNATDTKYYNYYDPLAFASLVNWATPVTVGVKAGFRF